MIYMAFWPIAEKEAKKLTSRLVANYLIILAQRSHPDQKGSKEAIPHMVDEENDSHRMKLDKKAARNSSRRVLRCRWHSCMTWKKKEKGRLKVVNEVGGRDIFISISSFCTDFCNKNLILGPTGRPPCGSAVSNCHLVILSWMLAEKDIQWWK